MNVDVVDAVEIVKNVSAVKAALVFECVCDQIAVFDAVDVIAERGVFMVYLSDRGSGKGVAEALVICDVVLGWHGGGWWGIVESGLR